MFFRLFKEAMAMFDVMGGVDRVVDANNNHERPSDRN